ncbi:MAG: efflux RND transporter periplasmic adaptor subunit [Bacteroidetes bacterium]|nr:MAG: efflux RND transporter periplasmic adaptor subunit [Bacteroidota bacterium]
MPLSLTSARPEAQAHWLAMSEEALRLADIRTAPAQPASRARVALHVAGKVVPDQTRRYRQIAHLPGRIERLYVRRTGQYVRRGQPIASIYSRELIAVIEAFKFSKNSPSVVRSAENNLAAWKVRPEQLEEFDLESGDYRKPIDVFADYSGVVTKLYVRDGDYAVNTHMGHPTVLFDLADLSQVWVRLDIHESDIPFVHRGDTVVFTADAVPGHTFTGTIAELTPWLDPHTRTKEARVVVANPDWLLEPEMWVRGTIETHLPPAFAKGVVVPRTAVLWTGQRSLVYVRHPDYDRPVFGWREVTLGPRVQDGWIVLEGLEPGEEIAVTGVMALDAAAQLSGKHSMMRLPANGDHQQEPPPRTRRALHRE